MSIFTYLSSISSFCGACLPFIHIYKYRDGRVQGNKYKKKIWKDRDLIVSMGKRKYTVCDVDDDDGVYKKMCTNFYDNFSYLVFHVRPRNEGEKNKKRAHTVGFRFLFGLYSEREWDSFAAATSTAVIRQAVGMETSLSEKREDEKRSYVWFIPGIWKWSH